MVCSPLREIIHSLKLVDYLHIQADKQRYNYYICIIMGKKRDMDWQPERTIMLDDVKLIYKFGPDQTHAVITYEYCENKYT